MFFFLITIIIKLTQNILFDLCLVFHFNSFLSNIINQVLEILKQFLTENSYSM